MHQSTLLAATCATGIVVIAIKLRELSFLSAFVPILCAWAAAQFGDRWTLSFCTIFSLRYTRLVGHLMASWTYRPYPSLPEPNWHAHEVTVILPTIDPKGPDFQECVLSILANKPLRLMVVTVGKKLLGECRDVLSAIERPNEFTEISVSSLPVASKRRQIAHAMPHVKTSITVLADDHVFWPSTDFLPSVLKPFEHPLVAVVATKKRVRRTTPGRWTCMSMVNFVACNYLQRHNWELRSNNWIDGGVFVVSGRTAVYKTNFLRDPKLMERFCNEKFFFGLFGGGLGLGPDDDNFLTREAMKQGKLIRFQDMEEATVHTTLGEWPKFRSQLLRWARTTFRSNPVMLRSTEFLLRYPWSYFMVYLAGVTNFALLWDGLLLYTLAKSAAGGEARYLCLLACFIFWTKTIKLWPHFWRCPSDFLLMPAQVVFAYLHSALKLWAMLTFWNCDWSGRKLEDINDHGSATGFEVIFPAHR